MACSLFCDWVMPERLVHRQLVDVYQDHPMGARVIAAPVGAFTGFVKVPLFPIICAVGVVAMPIIALVQHCRGSDQGGQWLGAWCFALLGVAGSLAFISVATFHIPLVATLGLVVVFLSISITCHVHQLVKEPCLNY